MTTTITTISSIKARRLRLVSYNLLSLLWIVTTSVHGFGIAPPKATSITGFSPRTTTLSAKSINENPSRTNHVARYKTFDEVLDRHHDETVLVCFEAMNCGPCRLMKKELDKLQCLLKHDDDEEEEESHGERPPSSSSPSLSSQRTPLKIFRLDTERYPLLGSRYGISRLPCLVFVKDHKVQLKLEGLNTATNIYNRFKGLRP